MSQLRDLFNKIEPKVREDFKKDGEIGTPIWFLENNNNDLILVATPFENNHTKDMAVLAVKEVIKEHNVVRYLFITETWFVSENIKDKPKTPWKQPLETIIPSKHPDRKEAVVVTGEDRETGENLMILLEIDRSGDKPILKENDMSAEMSVNSGRFTNMFDKRVTTH